MSFNELKYFIEALLLQLMAGTALKLFPFRVIIRIYRRGKVREEKSGSREVIREIARATGRASRFMFWKNRCLVQSLAGRKMLNRRGIQSELFIGMMPGENDSRRAHAWLKAGGTEIVGQGDCRTEIWSF